MELLLSAATSRKISLSHPLPTASNWSILGDRTSLLDHAGHAVNQGCLKEVTRANSVGHADHQVFGMVKLPDAI